MFRIRTLTMAALAAVLTASWVGVAVSQEKAPDAKGGADRKEGDRREGDRGRGGFQRMSPEEMQKRMEEFRSQMSNRMREQFGASEDDWKVLGPKIEKVQQLSRESRGGMGFGGMMFGRGRGPGGSDRGGPRPEGSSDRPQSEIEKTGSALRTVLQKEGATAAEIKSALDAYRTARTTARQNLETARKELKELLTTKQEAQAVMMGLLE